MNKPSQAAIEAVQNALRIGEHNAQTIEELADHAGYGTGTTRNAIHYLRNVGEIIVHFMQDGYHVYCRTANTRVLSDYEARRENFLRTSVATVRAMDEAAQREIGHISRNIIIKAPSPLNMPKRRKAIEGGIA